MSYYICFLIDKKVIMLVDNQKIDVKCTRANIDHYINKGYVDASLKSIISVSPEDLTDGSKKKVLVECDYCHCQVWVCWRDYKKYKYDKYSCVHCRQTKTSEYNLRQRQSYLYDGIISVCKENGYTLLTNKEDIITADSRVKYMCNKHGVNETKAYTLFLGHGCPGCAYEYKSSNAKLSPDLVEKRIGECGGTLLNKEDYYRWDSKNLMVTCLDCGKPFLTSYYAYINRGGQICPNCSKTKSFGEYLVLSYLDDNKINYQREYRFNDCKDKVALPFDFYLPDYNAVIEYQGRQHYSDIEYFGGTEAFEKRKRHDKIKKQYCKDNKIKFIEIPYWENDNIDKLLSDALDINTDKIYTMI